MIELPEACVLAEQIKLTLTGKTIVGAKANDSPHSFAWYSGDPAEYGDKLVGRKVADCAAFGGYIDVRLDGLTLSLNDGAKPRYFEKGKKLPPKHQLRLDFDDGSALTCAIQMYGGVTLPSDNEENFYRDKAKNDPSPLTDAFDRAYFEKLWNGAKQTLNAKAFLATEQRVPGLGNGVLHDILFNARIHPKRKLADMGEREREGLFESVKTTLKAMTERGGRDTFKDLFGNPGGYSTVLSSKTASAGCPVCRGEIVREAYLGGNIYYCPNCQPLNHKKGD